VLRQGPKLLDEARQHVDHAIDLFVGREQSKTESQGVLRPV
jgi:hypothetical protein